MRDDDRMHDHRRRPLPSLSRRSVVDSPAAPLEEEADSLTTAAAAAAFLLP